MRDSKKINLCKPAVGLLLNHSYHQYKSEVVSDFCRSNDMAAFKKWFFNEPNQSGCELLDAESRKNIFTTEALKGSQFSRFMLSNDKTLFGYSLDINWKKNGNWMSTGGHKHYGFVKADLLLQNAKKHLLDAVVASEVCQTKRPARIIFDLDGTPENIELSVENLEKPKNKEEF